MLIVEVNKRLTRTTIFWGSRVLIKQHARLFCNPDQAKEKFLGGMVTVGSPKGSKVSAVFRKKLHLLVASYLHKVQSLIFQVRRKNNFCVYLSQQMTLLLVNSMSLFILTVTSLSSCVCFMGSTSVPLRRQRHRSAACVLWMLWWLLETCELSFWINFSDAKKFRDWCESECLKLVGSKGTYQLVRICFSICYCCLNYKMFFLNELIARHLMVTLFAFF